ncbi:galectin-10-like [Myotis yumanensis]|uniref:galectin-10-like n=1 Tax=Myotis yumanensis TaxID=159337 RepID=UPI0038D4F041
MAALPVPYKRTVFLPVGSSVKIQGTPTKSFSMRPELFVDFHTGTQEDSDIAFHFRVCFGKHVIMNIRKGGKWGQEVRSPVMPFENGHHFELGILVLLKEYQVTVNGRQYYTFPHRLDPGYVKMIHIWKDVSLTSVTIT